MEVAFVVGSPRSGTTILENILDVHPSIASWYEPYYLWESYFPSIDSDIWSDRYLDEKSRKKIQREFRNFSIKANSPIILDKSPGHVFNIRIIHDIFPEAKWIHILRDGRDVTLSIKKEWVLRKQIVTKKDFINLFRTALTMLRRQPFWRYRFMAIYYEIRSNASFNPLRYLNKSKWNGMVGWGPRFENWHKYLSSHTMIEFNAMQWVKCIEALRKNWDIINEKNKIEIRYEDLLAAPKNTLIKIFDMLELDIESEFFEQIPKLMEGNYNKWAFEFTREELQKIKPILSSMIYELGYSKTREW